MPAAKKKAAAKKSSNVPAKRQETLPATMMDAMAADAGGGVDAITSQDMSMPFLQILQSGSPQLKKNNPKFIKGAEEGMIINSVSGETAEEVRFIPCVYRKSFVEWKPRDEGGGYIAEWDRDSDIVKETPPNAKGKRILDNGHELIETATYYGLVESASGDWEPAVLAMSSSQHRVSRRWNTVMKKRKLTTSAGRKFTPPLYSHIHTLRTQPESNDQGDWYGWDIELEGELIADADLYSLAQSMAEASEGRTGDARPEPDAE